MMNKSLALGGEEAWKKCEKVSAELFSAVYRAFIIQLLLDIQDPERVNAALFDLYISPSQSFVTVEWMPELASLRNFYPRPKFHASAQHCPRRQRYCQRY
jgi:hypothetical protein